MKQFAVTLLISLWLCSFVSAQSGRKVEPPAPTPAPSLQINEIPDYSESSPRERPHRVPKNISSANLKAATLTDSKDIEDVVKVETNLVTIPVSVFDRNGLYVPNLLQENFKVFEDDQEQEIAYFGISDKPFTVVLLIDTSPSTEYRIEEIRRAAAAFVNLLKPADKIMVIEFDGNVHVLAEPTGDRGRIYKAIQRADFGQGTALYDAVHFSLQKRLSKIAGRKAIVLFTDGVDTRSENANFDSTLDLAEESDTLIFPIYYNTFADKPTEPSDEDAEYTEPAIGTSAAEYAVGKKYLESLAAYTGGRIFQPEATPGGLTAAFEGIAEELRRQYNIGYVPRENGKPGQRKQIKVRVNRPNLVLRARDSYIVGAEVRPPGAKQSR